MNNGQAKVLKYYINKHVKSQIELAFKGCANPESWDEIENKAKANKKALFEYIKGIVQEWNKKPPWARLHGGFAGAN